MTIVGSCIRMEGKMTFTMMNVVTTIDRPFLCSSMSLACLLSSCLAILLLEMVVNETCGARGKIRKREKKRKERKEEMNQIINCYFTNESQQPAASGIDGMT